MARMSRIGQEFLPCLSCGRVLSADAFHWKNEAKGQRQSRCKDCDRAACRKRYLDNPAAHLAAQKTRREQRGPEQIERLMRNLALGNMNDNPKWLQAAATYLEGHR